MTYLPTGKTRHTQQHSSFTYSIYKIMSSSKLFQPIKVGEMSLNHRVVLAPLTRYRANIHHVHGDLAVEYYSQRASEPGTLLIGEGAFITGKAGGYAHAPGLWSDDQVAAWKKVGACHQNRV